MKKALLILTFSCRRQCEGCCNTYEEVMKHALRQPAFHFARVHTLGITLRG